MAFGFGKKSSPDDDIKKLSRAELLEMLIDQTRLADRLRIRNKRLTKELEECKANLERAASLEIIMTRLEKIERIAAMHVGFTEEEIAELEAIGAPDPEEEVEIAEETWRSEAETASEEEAESGEEAVFEEKTESGEEAGYEGETASEEETSAKGDE